MNLRASPSLTVSEVVRALDPDDQGGSLAGSRKPSLARGGASGVRNEGPARLDKPWTRTLPACLARGVVLRGVFGTIKRELRRRSAIEAVIGHMKTDGHLGRCYLKGREGDAANTILTAVGYNLRLVLAWLRIILRLIINTLLRAFASQSPLKSYC